MKQRFLAALALVLVGVLAVVFVPVVPTGKYVLAQSQPGNLAECSGERSAIIGPLRWSTSTSSIAYYLLGVDVGPAQPTSFTLGNATYVEYSNPSSQELVSYPASHPEYQDLLHVSELGVSTIPFGGTQISIDVANRGTNETADVTFGLGAGLPPPFTLGVGSNEGPFFITAGASRVINFTYHGNEAPSIGSSAVVQTWGVIWYGTVNCPYIHAENVPVFPAQNP